MRAKIHQPNALQDVEHLKPHIVHALASAELYCRALSHLYADPNYHNLNHWGVIQALARKGVFVTEPSDCSLTETVLIQTTPLKMVSELRGNVELNNVKQSFWCKVNTIKSAHMIKSRLILFSPL